MKPGTSWRVSKRVPQDSGPAAQDICYATENRQVAVKAVAPLCEVLLVVGSQNSSNSRRLVEVCEKMGVPAYLVDDLTEVRQEWLENVRTVAVTAGASAPENLVQELVEFLQQRGFAQLEEMEVKEEDVRFNLPAELTRTVAVTNRCTGMSSPSLQIADTLLATSSADVAPRGRLPAQPPHRRGLLVRRAHRRHHARIRLHSAGAVAVIRPSRRRLESAHPRADRQGRPVHSGAPVARWRLQHLSSKGPSEVSASVKAYCRAEAGRHRFRGCRAWFALRERILALGGLQAANSYVKINLSLFGLYPREHYAVDSSRDHAAGQLDLRDVLLDAGHRDSALDRARA